MRSSTFPPGRFTLVSDVRFQGALMGAAAEDQEGNLWVASQTGLLRVARRGFTTFREPDGLGRTVARVFVSHAGEPIAISEGWRVSRFNGESFHTVRANVPESARRFGPSDWGGIEDRAGDWWFATGVGLVRFSRVKRIEDLATMAPRLYTSRDGLAQDDIRSLFEDASGGIWIAGLIPGREVLTRWDRASGQFRRYSDADGLPAFNSPTTFYEDPRGVLWITFRDGGIARYEAGHFRMLTESNGLPRGGIGAAIVDHMGRLWCSNTLLGLYRIDDLNAEQLQPVFVATPKVLRGALIARIVEDAFGSIYVATPQGVMRIDDTSASGAPSARIAGVYGTNDGLASTEVLGASSDRQGRLCSARGRGCLTTNRNNPSALRHRKFASAGCASPVWSIRCRPPVSRAFHLWI
jgi:ligand-binding sensor domain-containing protein